MTKPQADAPPQAEQAEDPFENLVPGRIVHYWPSLHQERSACPGPWPAMVTAIGHAGGPGIVVLNINLPMPTPIGDDPVQRLSGVEYAGDGDKAGKWTWPER